MQKKQLVLQKVLVEDYAAEGKSLSKLDGKVMFIEGAVPGDIIDLQIIKSKKDWAEGRPVRFHEFSKDRVEPFCEHFGVCGGCKWQMLPYNKQLHYKENEVAQQLRRIGKVTLPVIAPILGANQTRRYRNKLDFTFSNRRYLLSHEIDRNTVIAQENALGFHVPRIFDKVVDINTCHLMEEPTNIIKNTIRDFASLQGYSYYDVKKHQGWLRNLILRVCQTGEVMVNVCFSYEDALERQKLFDHLLLQVPSITSLLYTINPKWNDSINDLHPQVYSGNGYITERLEDFIFRIGPKSFFQTNTFQGELLYKVTREFAELTGEQIVYDLYCGTGSIGIFLSRHAKKIIGVDVIDEAIRDARENANLNGVAHAQFYSGDVIDVCNDQFFQQHGHPDVIITDPPRSGMHEKLLNKINEMEAQTVVYVSCNPATQARDLNMLDEKYCITRVQPIDMFPHTHHIENVVQLKKRQ
ncbi:MAG: 23S rRNA (uracil(1939)-C(5))-methyltransferase RlmD [Chitinophagaceae bacterium]